MKLDVNVLRYLSREDFRVLTAIEMGQKNHEIVPVPLIDSISKLKHGGTHRALKVLLRHKLIHHDASKYDGYRLTYQGYDYLAIKTLVARGHIASVGRQIGVGKESDIFEVMNDDGDVLALKLHRLGRTSFRDVKSKRDYLGRRSSYSWLYLSRLSALKEYAFMKALGDRGFPVPVAVDSNRHAVLMSMVDAVPLVQVRRLTNPASVYAEAVGLVGRLAQVGLVHCDFNEFNLLISDDEELTMIDFPQMVSLSHANARELFDRDVDCLVRFFNKKVGYMPQHDDDTFGEQRPWRPSFEAAVAAAAVAAASQAGALDVELAASGFKHKHQEALEQYAAAVEGDGKDEAGASGSEGADEDDDDEEDVEDVEDPGGSEEGQEQEGGEHALMSAGPHGSGSRASEDGEAPAGPRPRAEHPAERSAVQALGHGLSRVELEGGDGDARPGTCGDSDDEGSLSGGVSSSGSEDEHAAQRSGRNGRAGPQAASWARQQTAVPVAPGGGGDVGGQERVVQQRTTAQRKAAAQRATQYSRNSTKPKFKKGARAGGGGGIDW